MCDCLLTFPFAPRTQLHVKSQQKRRAFMRDPRSKIWHAYVAGAVSSLAVLAETKSNRISLAQQLFVRGLEGSYNVAHAKGKINIPHGAVLAFGLACGQIMYAWLNAPETLPRGYVNWITNASMVTPRVTPIHRDIAYGRKPDVDSVVKHWFPGGVLPDPIKVTSAGREIFGNTARTPGNRRGMTARNTTKIVEWVKRVRAGGDPGVSVRGRSVKEHTELTIPSLPGVHPLLPRPPMGRQPLLLPLGSLRRSHTLDPPRLPHPTLRPRPLPPHGRLYEVAAASVVALHLWRSQEQLLPGRLRHHLPDPLLRGASAVRLARAHCRGRQWRGKTRSEGAQMAALAPLGILPTLGRRLRHLCFIVRRPRATTC